MQTPTGKATTAPQITSRKECCFTNTVEAQMSSPMTTMGQRHFRSRRLSKAAMQAPAQPTTCMLGSTLVLVSAA